MQKTSAIVAWLFLFVAVTGCSNSTSGPPSATAESLKAAFSFGLVRGDIPTSTMVSLFKPFAPAATVELVGTPTGLFAPASGTLPKIAPRGVQFDVEITFTPPISGDTFQNGSIRLRVTSLDGRFVDTVDVALTAETEFPTITLATASVSFGPTALGEAVTRIVEIQNPNQATPITITGATVPGGDFVVVSAFPVSIQPRSSVGIPVRYTPSSTGPSSASLGLSNSLGTPLNTLLSGSGIPSEVLIDLGFVPVDAGGLTPWLEFTVEPEAASIHFEIFGDDPSADFFLIGLEGPGGYVYENDTLTGPYTWLKNFPLAFEALFLQLPNSDDPAVQLVPGGGTYRLRLFELSPLNSGFHIRVIVEQRNSGRISFGHLPLNIFLSDGLSIDVSDAPTDPKLQEALQTVDMLFKQVGLRVGSVSYFKLNDPAFDDIGSFAELDALQELSSAAPEARLNMFMVNTISIDGGGFLGVAGAVPGIKRNGTIFSGVVTVYDDVTGPFVGSTAAHEGGHYLGLFHTTGFDDFGFINGVDLILDTPICFLNEIDFECLTIGNDNLLWPFELGFVDLDLTAGQGSVLLNHPLVEPGDPPGGPLTRLGKQALSPGPGAALPLRVRRPWCANCAGLVGSSRWPKGEK